MARYFKHLQYHEDVTEKHPLTAEEVQFLMELQKEMNTQDYVGQADPRFWVIKGTKKEYGFESEYEDGEELISGGEVVATDMDSAAEYIKRILDEINDTCGIRMSMERISGIWHRGIRISWMEDGFEDFVELNNMDEVVEWLRDDQGYAVSISRYRMASRIYRNTMFLTQKAAENHLKENHYHYSEDAHTYAMTSWRNPETEMLWKILRQVDWELLLSNVKPTSRDGAKDADQPTLSCGA